VPDGPAATITLCVAGALDATCPDDGDHDQGDEEPKPVTGSAARTGRGLGRSMLAFRSVMSALSSFVVRSSSTNSRSACGRQPAAAVLGRQRQMATTRVGGLKAARRGLGASVTRGANHGQAAVNR
jgi:hypothetical protein